MAEDADELSPSQTEKLLQFQDLTGMEDMQQCRQLLQSHNWDLEVAVQDTLNMHEGSPSVFHPQNNYVPPPPVVMDAPDQRIYSATTRWQPTGIFGWGYFFIIYPWRFLYNSLLNLMKFTLSLIRPDPRRYVTDPVGDVVTFIRKYEEKYGARHPVFYRGTYSQALNDAKRELRFLLVYLHSEDHGDTAQFCRTTLGHREVINYINSSMLFWACSVNLPEGYRVSQSLRENTYPFLAVIVLRENRMTIVARLEGMIEPQELIKRLQRVISDNESALIATQLERQERNFNQILRKEQDEAYMVSLRADQEKERRRKEERERREREEKERKEMELQKQRWKEEIRRQKIELVDQIPPEPSLDEVDVVRVVIKLPSGTRLERRFKRSHSLKYLYYFVFCHDESPDAFQIVTNFPRQVLPCQPTPEVPEPPTFGEMQLGRSEMLFVQDLEA